MSCFTLNKLKGLHHHQRHSSENAGRSSSSSSSEKSSPPSPNNFKQHRSFFQAIRGRSSCPSSPSSSRNVELRRIKLLKEELQSLSSQLSIVTQERDYFERTLNDVQIEKHRLCREKDEQLYSVSARYEDRLTELHSVISELSRQVEATHQIDDDNVEDWEDESESNMSRKKSLKRRRRTSLESDEEKSNFESKMEFTSMTSSSNVNTAAVESGKTLPNEINGQENEVTKGFFNEEESSFKSLQFNALHEELANIRERNVHLIMRLREKETDLEELESRFEVVTKENEVLKSIVNNTKFRSRHASPRTLQKRKLRKPGDERREESCELKSSDPEESPNLLSSAFKLNLVSNTHQNFKGTLGLNKKTNNTSTNEEIREEHRIETDKLLSKIEHLNSQKNVLNMILNESKVHCEKLTFLIGKYESNFTVQKLVIESTENITEGHEVLLALLETGLGVLQANCKSMPQFEKLVEKTGNRTLTNGKLIEQALKNRVSAENLANCFLNKLDASASTTNDLSIELSNSSAEEYLDNHVYENKIREYILEHKLKISKMKSTLITEMENHYSSNLSPSFTNEELQAQCIENSELSSIREERAELKAKLFLLNKEKTSFELLINAYENQENVLCTHIRHLKTDLSKLKNDDGVHYGNISNEKLVIENQDLRNQVYGLLKSLKKEKNNSELIQLQSKEIISDFKRNNSTLCEELDRSKKKYQAKLKKLEQQILRAMLQNQFPLTCASETSESE